MAAPQYRGLHLVIRSRFMAQFRNGQPCAECGRPLYRWQPMHLSHDHVHGGYKGLSHSACNIGEANSRRAGKIPRHAAGRRW